LRGQLIKLGKLIFSRQLEILQVILAILQILLHNLYKIMCHKSQKVKKKKKKKKKKKEGNLTSIYYGAKMTSICNEFVVEHFLNLIGDS
jgi:hypothetical protein